MKKTITTSILFSTMSLAAIMPTTSFAVEGLSANIGATSNYLWRGVSQTDDAAAISGGIDYEGASGFYAGTWVSNIDFGDDASYELDLYFGFSGDMGDVTYDVGYIYYAYPDSSEMDSSNEYDFGEIYGSLGFGAFSLSAFYGIHNDDGAGFADESLYLSGDAEFEIAQDLMLGLHIGSYNFDASSDDYIDYAASLSKDGFTLTLSDTDLDNDSVKVVVSYSVDFDL